MGWLIPRPRTILAGLTLIAQAIRSANYVAGVSGWTINSDGSAEFNDVAVRGELDIQGADGSEITANASGGSALMRFTPPRFVIVPGVTNNPGAISTNRLDSPGNGFSSMLITGPHPNNVKSPIIGLISQSIDGTTSDDAIGLGATQVTVTGKFVSGQPSFIGNFANPAGGLVSGAVTDLGFGSASSNLGLMWSGGASKSLTIPTGYDGTYECQIDLTFATNVTGIRQAGVKVNAATFYAWNFTPVTGFNTQAHGVIRIPGLNVGDVITFSGFQNSGGALSIVGTNIVSFFRVPD